MTYISISRLFRISPQDVSPAILAIDLVMVGVAHAARGVELVPPGRGCADSVHLGAVLEGRGLVCGRSSHLRIVESAPNFVLLTRL